MASEVGAIDSVELEPLRQPNNTKNKNDNDDDNLASTSNATNAMTTATLTIVKPNSMSAISAASDNEDTHLNPYPTSTLAAMPSTSRQLFSEAASAHGGHESTSFLQQEISQQQRLKSASSTLDKSVSRNPSSAGKHEKKIGHRRVDDEGEVTYKKIQSKQIMGSIQLGIQHTVGSLASKPKRDLLMNDFFEMETISFPPDGSSITPAHHYSEFRFKVYAPIAFRYFRDLFGIAPDDFLMSMCAAPLRQLSNPGASGSIFYLTDDDEFIIKTVQKKECEFLQKLLPGYYMNLSQNPRTLLPKFFGLYCFHYNAKNVRLVAMNNLLPSDIKMHAKYDLKGSTFRRKASKAERQKASPTYKDLDFMEHHPNGIFLETDKYNALIKTIQRDCMVLESFQIMDYSLLVGIHNLDLAAKEKREERIRNARAKLQRTDEIREADEAPEADQVYNAAASSSAAAGSALNRSRSMNRHRLVAHSTAMESITADIDTPFEEDEDIPAGGIPARSENDERLILYIGIIDILQSYRLEKKLEHTFKAIIYNGDTVSVCRPSFYAQRFQNFMGKTVFKKTPTFPLKHSPSKRKTSNATARTPQRTPSQSVSSNRPPFMSGSSTPPPAFDDISEEDITANSSTAVRISSHSRNLMPQKSYMSSHRSTLGSTTDDYSDDDLASTTGSTRSPMQRKKAQLHLSKTNVHVTTVGCIEDQPSPHQPHHQPDHKQSDEGIEQDVDGKKVITTKSTFIQAKQEQIYTSTLVVNDVGFTHTSVIEMAFQRSYSKVWWGSDDNQLPGMNVMNSANQHLLNTNPNTVSLTSGGMYSYFSQQQHPQQQQRNHHQQPQQHQQFQQFGGIAYHSLDLNQYKSYGGNLSRIQEVEDEHNISKLSWEKHDSPGSLRSQDSGFSDNDEFHSTRSLSGRSSKTSSPSSKSIRSSKSDIGSPTSVRTVQTPPTVIRRTGNSEFYTPLVNVSRRISFSFSATPNKNSPKQEDDEGSSLMAKLDSMQLMTESPLAKKLDFDDSNITHSSDAVSPIKGNNPRIKRRRKVQRKATSPLSAAHKRLQKLNNEMDEEEDDSDLDSSLAVPEYNNETVYLGGAPTCSTPPPPYNNETVVLGGPMESSYNNTLKLEEQGISPLRLNARFSGNTSTPKTLKIHKPACTLPPLFACQEYDNTLLNGHTEDVQTWLDDLRMSYDHEVMSTLQTKSIAQEAFKNLQITTNTVAKFIRQLQQKALSMQSSFEKVERMLGGTQNVSLHDALTGSLQLLDHVSEFTLILERRSVFFADSRLERKRYEDYLDQIRMVNKDTRYSLENHHYINLESLLEDLQVLKRILLISVQQVYEKLVRILVISVENGRCDLMLKANINMIATLMNIDYEGFASLTNAFVQTEAVRTLLVVCLDHKLSSVRAQALRALATICCAPEPIAQLGSCGGIEIIRDILQVSGAQKPKIDIKRGDMERREAVSLLTQITAAWHGPEHKVNGLKGCIETIVEGLTQLLIFTECPQTLLLCTAALNNLSRMEITSHYSIMSHETIFKLITTMEQRDKGINVFLYEQIVAMLYNMSLNKKCHSHLANAGIINFITYAYETEFFKSYNSRGESEAQKRCIKTILHTLTRLVQDSVLGMELLEQQKHMPSSLFFKLNSTQDAKQQLSSLDANSNSSRDISFLTHQLLQQAKNDRDEQLQHQLHPEIAERGKKFKMQLQRQESYV